MMRRLLISAALVSLFVLAAPGGPPLAAAERHTPDVTFLTDSGRTMRLADLRGKVVLVDFWASWCIPCRRSFPELSALQRDFASRGLVVIAVNVDEQRKNATTFMEQYPHAMTVAFDPKGTAAEAFGVQGMPTSTFIDRAGRIRFTHMGYTEKTLDQFRGELLQLLGES